MNQMPLPLAFPNPIEEEPNPPAAVSTLRCRDQETWLLSSCIKERSHRFFSTTSRTLPIKLSVFRRHGSSYHSAAGQLNMTISIEKDRSSESD